MCKECAQHNDLQKLANADYHTVHDLNGVSTSAYYAGARTPEEQEMLEKSLPTTAQLKALVKRSLKNLKK